MTFPKNNLTNQHNITTTVVNLRFIKPLDESLIPLINQAKRVVVIEDGAQIGGVYHYILNQCQHLNKPLNEWLSFAIPDRFIDHRK